MLRTDDVPTPAPTTPPQRDAHGRFAKGNRGGPGNPFVRQGLLLRRAFVQAVTEETVQRIAAALVRQAEQGDAAAAALVLSYRIGRPCDTSRRSVAAA